MPEQMEQMAEELPSTIFHEKIKSLLNFLIATNGGKKEIKEQLFTKDAIPRASDKRLVPLRNISASAPYIITKKRKMMKSWIPKQKQIMARRVVKRKPNKNIP